MKLNTIATILIASVLILLSPLGTMADQNQRPAAIYDQDSTAQRADTTLVDSSGQSDEIDKNLLVGATLGLPGGFNGVVGYQHDFLGVRLAGGYAGLFSGAQLDLLLLFLKEDLWHTGIALTNGALFGEFMPFTYSTLSAYVNNGGVDLMFGYGFQWGTDNIGMYMASIGYVVYLER